MKNIVVLSSALVLGAMASEGQTTTVQPATHQASRPIAQKGATNNVVPAHLVPPNTLVNKSQLRPEDVLVFKRIESEHLLIPQRPTKNYSATLESIFRLEDNDVADVQVRSPFITIFPTGH